MKREVRTSKIVVALLMLLSVAVVMTMLPGETIAYNDVDDTIILSTDDVYDGAEEYYYFTTESPYEYNDEQYYDEQNYDEQYYDDADIVDDCEYLDTDENEAYYYESENEYVGIVPSSGTNVNFRVYRSDGTRLNTGENVLEWYTGCYHVTNLLDVLTFYHRNCIDTGVANIIQDAYVYRHSWSVSAAGIGVLRPPTDHNDNVANFFGVEHPEGRYTLIITGYFDYSVPFNQASSINVNIQRTSSFVDIEGNTTSTEENPVRQPSTVTVGRPSSDTYGNYRYYWRIVDVATNNVVNINGVPQNGHSVGTLTANINIQGDRDEYFASHGPHDIDVSQFPPGLFRVYMTVREIVPFGFPYYNIYHESIGYFEIIHPPRIEKEANRIVSSVNDVITYKITVTNPNHVNLDGEFVVVDVLDTRFVHFVPGTLTVNGIPLSENDFSYNAGTGVLRVYLDGLPANSETIIRFGARVQGAALGQVIRNIAVLERPDDDDIPSDEVLVPVPRIRKTSSPAISNVGDEILYAITVTNPSSTPIATNFTVVDLMNVEMVRFIPESLTMIVNGNPVPISTFNFNPQTGVLSIPINPLQPGNTVITYRVEVLEAAAGQIVRNVAILEVPGDGDNPRDEEDVPVREEPVYRHIRIYYFIRGLDGTLRPDMVHNPAGRDYWRRIGDTFNTNHVIDRNQLPGNVVYTREDWSVVVYGYEDDTYLDDKDLTQLRGSFVVPPPSFMLPDAVALDIVAMNDGAVGETINLIIIWSYTEAAGEDDDDKDDDDDDDKKELPKTGIDGYTEIWATLLLVSLLLIARMIMAISKNKKKIYSNKAAS